MTKASSAEVPQVMPSPSAYSIPTDQVGQSELCNQSISYAKELSASENCLTLDIIDHMARLDFKIDPQGGTLISFHYEYNDYLDEIGCVDPLVAKEIQTRQKKPEEQGKVLPSAAEGEVNTDEKMDENNEHDLGRFKFQNVLKSMVARLELYDGLAPIQEYGRH